MQHLSLTNRSKAFHFLAWQFVFGAIISVLAGIIWEVQTGQSLFVGVLLDVLPSFVFTIYAFRFSGAQNIQHIAASFYRGETVKIMLTGALFVAVIKFLPVSFPVVFIGFLIMKLSQFSKTIFF